MTSPASIKPPRDTARTILANRRAAVRFFREARRVAKLKGKPLP